MPRMEIKESPAPLPKKGFSLHRLLMFVALALVVWVVVTQTLPRLMGDGPVPKTAFTAGAPQGAITNNAPTPPVFPEHAIDNSAYDVSGALAARLAELESRVVSLESKPQMAEKHNGEEAAQKALEERIDAMEVALAQAKAELSQRVTANQKQGWEHVANIQAFYRLNQAIEQGREFADLLAPLQKSEEMRPFIESLEALSSEPIPSVARLKGDFQTSLREALNPPAEESDSLWQKVKINLSQLVRVRRLGVQEGQNDGAVLSRAEAKLADEGLASAVAELQNLSSPAKASFTDWLAQADRRLEAEENLKQMEQQLNTVDAGA